MTFFERTGVILARAWWLAVLIIATVILSFCAYMAYGETITYEGPMSFFCSRNPAIAPLYSCYIDERGALHLVNPYDPTDANQTTLPDEFKSNSSGELTIPYTEMKGYEMIDNSQAIPTVGIDPDGDYHYIQVDRQGRVLVSPESGCRP